VFGQQLVARALLDDAAEEVVEKLLLVDGQDVEHLGMCLDRIGDDRRCHRTPLVGEVGLTDTAVLRVLLAFYESATLQGDER
jgi:hypothetical protein